MELQHALIQSPTPTELNMNSPEIYLGETNIGGEHCFTKDA